jgi:hypothetical protein
LIAYGCEQPVLAVDNFAAGVEDHKAAGAIGVLGFTGAKAGLPHGGSLLIAQSAR